MYVTQKKLISLLELSLPKILNFEMVSFQKVEVEGGRWGMWDPGRLSRDFSVNSMIITTRLD